MVRPHHSEARSPSPKGRRRTQGITAAKRAGGSSLSIHRALAAPADARPADVLALQRDAGNRAVTVVLQREKTKTTVLDPEIAAVDDNLQLFCGKGTDIAWDLYRAILQVQSDAANDKYGRMVTDSDIAGSVTAAHASHQQALQSFIRLRREGATHRAAAQSEAAKDTPDMLALNDHVLGLVELAEKAASQITSIANRAWDLAIQAEESGHLAAARHAFRAADGAEEVAGEQRPRVRLNTGRAPVDKLGLVYGMGIDTGANTIGGGTYGNALSIVGVVAKEGSSAANFSSGTGMVFAPLAVLCSSVALVLGVVGAVKSGRRKEQLELLQWQLADPRAREAARYAIEQKDKKRTRRWISSGAALAGLAAGIAGCVAIGITTFGVGALVIGLVAGAIGLGLLAYKIYRRSERARKSKMKAFAKSIVEAATDESADPADRELAREHIRALGHAPLSDDFTGISVRDLAATLSSRAESQREAAAEGLLDLCVNGRRSERRDAELVLAGLKLDPAELRGLAEGDKGEQALDMVKGKLASW
ncbi:MAG: hypothetical protein GEU74_08180 [Nitriliruptorales bacterium]|nr:hypothetical protein [Nitriliruptorales bacterium]